MQRTVIVILATLVSVCVSVTNVMAADAGRYQVVVVRGTDEGMVVLKFDTTTGKTWIFDSMSVDIADATYLKSQGITENLQYYQELEKKGYVAGIPPYWKAMPERGEGVSIRPIPGRK